MTASYAARPSSRVSLPTNSPLPVCIVTRWPNCPAMRSIALIGRPAGPIPPFRRLPQPCRPARARVVWFWRPTPSRAAREAAHVGDCGGHREQVVRPAVVPDERDNLLLLAEQPLPRRHVGPPRCSTPDPGLLPGGNTHLLQHFATAWLRNDAGLNEVRRLLEHTSLATTLRYLSLVSADLQRAHRQAGAIGRLRLT